MINSNCSLRFTFLQITFFLIIHWPLHSIGQSINIAHGWTDGFEALYVERNSGGIIHFAGGNLHDGGDAFDLRIQKNGSLEMVKDGSNNSERNPEDKVELKTINNKQVLIFRDKSGQITNFYRQLNPHEDLRKLIIANMVNHDLAGKYINPANGKIIVFHPDKQTATGLTSSSEYEFEESYDEPVEIITFKNKQRYQYETTDNGLDLYSVKSTESDDWEKGKKVMSLVKKEWLNTDSLKNIPGRYPFASAEILIDCILGCYTSKQLALMRNEIFARHGLIFKSTSLNNYFTKLVWYKPQFEDVSSHLTELEKLNIQLIQRLEAKAKDAEEEKKNRN